MYALIPNTKSVTQVTPDEIHFQCKVIPNFRRNQVTHIFLTIDSISPEFSGLFMFDRRMLQILETRGKQFHADESPSVIIKYGTVHRVNYVPPQLPNGKLRYTALIDFRLIVVGRNLFDISRELDSANNLQMIDGYRTGMEI